MTLLYRQAGHTHVEGGVVGPVGDGGTVVCARCSDLVNVAAQVNLLAARAATLLLHTSHAPLLKGDGDNVKHTLHMCEQAARWTTLLHYRWLLTDLGRGAAASHRWAS
jgi:hypothetical protein